MAKEQDTLWKGGSWEQSIDSYPTPYPLDKNISRRINRTNTRRRRGRSFLHGLRLVLGISLALAVSIAIFIGVSGSSIPITSITVPGITSGGSVGGSSGSSGSGGGSAPGGYVQEETSNPVNDPLLPQAELLEEPLISFTESTGTALTPQEIYAEAQYSVVYIETLTATGIGAGTGVILSEDGYIITNAHVVSDALQATVVLWDETYYSASVVGWDVDEDLAVLKIDAQGLTPINIGNSADLVVGDAAYAIGNPMGAEYRSTFTDGIISALDRYLDIDGVYMSLIQTTTPINSGNSGGALLNDQGQLVGITTIKLMSSSSSVENMGFAIPSTRVVQVVNCLVQGIELTTPALGITVYEVVDPVRGLYVQEVIEDSYADDAGLLPGDILLSAVGVLLNYTPYLMQIKDSLLVGDTLTVTVMRGDDIFDLDVILSDYALVHPDA